MSRVEISLDGLNLNPDDDRREVSGMVNIERDQGDARRRDAHEMEARISGYSHGLTGDAGEVERLRRQLAGAVGDRDEALSLLRQASFAGRSERAFEEWSERRRALLNRHGGQ